MAYQTVNPANNQLIKTYPAHSDADVEAALQQADALYHSAWAKGDIEPRLAVLHKLADLIDSRAEELAKIASQEMGKLIKQSRGEVKLCAQIARYYADNAKSFLAPVKYPSELGEAWVEHHPIGVLLAVEPWNFPYYQLMRVLAPKGGNDVFVVLDDADLERAVKIGVQARLNNAGQVCTAAKRFILHENIADAFLTKFSEAFRQVKIGDPLDESTTLGPLSSKDALDTLSKQVDEAVKNGAKLHLGGKAVAREGNFFEPTILTGITRDNPAYFEEFFGPVAQIYVVKNDEEAIQLANDSHYGLGGAVFSQDIERAKRMASAIETGMVYINWLTDTAPELPFGGVKRSGYGRELSDLGIKEFVNQKLVVVRR
ncbi:MAG: aldehyde dehydrogenase family protein [Klebsiella pneumoniae]|nr:aldehyde dehydrogenase family protein [Klebsiella pneumoniae]